MFKRIQTTKTGLMCDSIGINQLICVLTLALFFSASVMASGSSGSGGSSGHGHHGNSICDGESNSQLFKLCHKYCEKLKCDKTDDVSQCLTDVLGESNTHHGYHNLAHLFHNNTKKCEKIKRNYVRHGGGDTFPCERSKCPCDTEFKRYLSDGEFSTRFGELPYCRYFNTASGPAVDATNFYANDVSLRVSLNGTLSVSCSVADSENAVNLINISEEEPLTDVLEACDSLLLRVATENGCVIDP